MSLLSIAQPNDAVRHSMEQTSQKERTLPNLPRPDQRRQLLLDRRDEKMARSPHAYVRGNTAQYYEWLQAQPGHSLPEGPPIWICGDCHLGNLGPLASADGSVELQIRDFDQSVIGNPAHDLVRLALSLAVAARGSSLPGVVTASMLQHMLKGYAFAFLPAELQGTLPRPAAVSTALRGAEQRSWKELAEERFLETRPIIPMGRNFWPISKEEKKAIRELCASSALRALVTRLKSRKKKVKLEVIDAAYWVKGCSSLGFLRYAVLLGIGDGEYCLIDIKEAVQATSVRYADASMPRDNAKRVVAGARHLSPALGERTMPQRFLGRGIFVRELLPQDLKLEIDELSVEDAASTASYLAYVVGCAHARQMDWATGMHWVRQLQEGREHGSTIPSWLWNSVLQLIASHETGYLEHCRNYALRQQAQ